jgi:hypothetical protein
MARPVHFDPTRRLCGGSTLNFWGVTLNPPPDGDVIGVQTTLGEQLLDIAVRVTSTTAVDERLPGSARLGSGPMCRVL